MKEIYKVTLHHIFDRDACGISIHNGTNAIGITGERNYDDAPFHGFNVDINALILFRNDLDNLINKQEKTNEREELDSRCSTK